jgi:tRNA pseudouridine55 synthase
MIEGILILDKPAGVSSARAVAMVKRLLPRKTKVGHAGTLDPFATGVLLILIGKATRSCERLMDCPKTYEAVMRLGAMTPTDDPESPPVAMRDAKPPSPEELAAAAALFVGTILQRPPAFSAMKIAGHRAYDLARSGKVVNLAPRLVRVDAIRIESYRWPDVYMTVECGRGFYVRALARDLGERLGVGGYLTALRRTAIGPFRIADAVKVEQLTAESIETRLRPVLVVEPRPPTSVPEI